MRATNRVIAVEELITACEQMGNLFESSARFTLSTGQQLDTIFKTGGKPVIVFDRKLSYDGAGVDAFIFRDSTFTGGTDLPGQGIYCNNDFFPNSTSTVSIVTDAAEIVNGPQTRTTIYNFGNSSNQSKGGALQAIDRPWFVPPSKVNTLRLVNYDANSQVIASHLYWIEFNTNIPGIELIDGVWTYKGIIL